MKRQTLSQTLFGNRAKARYLYLVAAILFFTVLGSRELWTQEHRWADIVTAMFMRHDFLHPYLGDQQYYDKPLLSYWMMAALSKCFGGVTTWALRLPSAFAGLLAVWSVVRIGTQVKDRSLGLLSGWLLITTYYIVFWARVSSADMLNVAGSLFAIAWYLDHRRAPRFFDYLVFFTTIALTSLCKGLGGAIVPLLAVLVDVVLSRQWLKHCRWTMVLALLPALVIYFLPFWASSYFGGAAYGENGLYLVYRENILRYFHPFDHQDPFYTYFIFLPVYMLPWTVLFIPALLALPGRIKRGLKPNERWLHWVLLAVFLFFTLSGSRRSYYVLPMVPFAILVTADWIQAKVRPRLQKALAVWVIIMAALLWVVVDLLPAWVAVNDGLPHFSMLVKKEASTRQPWDKWHVVLLDAESKVNFYLGLPPSDKNDAVIGDRSQQTSADLVARFPVLKNLPANTIFITRTAYLMQLLPYFGGYQVVVMPKGVLQRWFKLSNEGDPIAFIPLTTHHD